MSERPSFLYPFIEADERDASALLTDLAASARDKARESAALQHSTLAECADESTPPVQQMAERFAIGRPAVCVRQRRQLDGRRHLRRAVRAAGDGPPAAGAEPRRRPGRRDRAGQRRRLRTRVLASDHRACDEQRHRRRVLDQRQLGRPDERPAGGAAARPDDGRLRRLHRRRDGRVRRRRLLLRRRVAEHPPHPGEPGAARLPVVGHDAARPCTNSPQHRP